MSMDMATVVLGLVFAGTMAAALVERAWCWLSILAGLFLLHDVVATAIVRIFEGVAWPYSYQLAGAALFALVASAGYGVGLFIKADTIAKPKRARRQPTT